MPANASPKIFMLTAEMLKAKAADLDDLTAGLDDNELDVNELIFDHVD